ncbi:hypothetical protein L3Q82_019231, partial [Scortum barcoo]
KMMSSGDIQGCLRKLETLLRVIKYPGSVDYNRLAKGDPSAFLPLVSYTLISFSQPFAEQLNAAGLELTGKTDLRFTDTLYKVLRDIFQYKPILTKQQFLQWGFSQRKISVICDIINLVLQKHNQLKKPRVRCPTSHKYGRGEAHAMLTDEDTVSEKPFLGNHLENPLIFPTNSSHMETLSSQNVTYPSHNEVYSSSSPGSGIKEVAGGEEVKDDILYSSDVEGRLLALEAQLESLLPRLDRLSILEKCLEEHDRWKNTEKNEGHTITISKECWENLMSRVLLLETKLELSDKSLFVQENPDDGQDGITNITIWPEMDPADTVGTQEHGLGTFRMITGLRVPGLYEELRTALNKLPSKLQLAHLPRSLLPQLQPVKPQPQLQPAKPQPRLQPASQPKPRLQPASLVSSLSCQSLVSSLSCQSLNSSLPSQSLGLLTHSHRRSLELLTHSHRRSLGLLHHSRPCSLGLLHHSRQVLSLLAQHVNETLGGDLAWQYSQGLGEAAEEGVDPNGSCYPSMPRIPGGGLALAIFPGAREGPGSRSDELVSAPEERSLRSPSAPEKEPERPSAPEKEPERPSAPEPQPQRRSLSVPAPQRRSLSARDSQFRRSARPEGSGLHLRRRRPPEGLAVFAVRCRPPESSAAFTAVGLQRVLPPPVGRRRVPAFVFGAAVATEGPSLRRRLWRATSGLLRVPGLAFSRFACAVAAGHHSVHAFFIAVAGFSSYHGQRLCGTTRKREDYLEWPEYFMAVAFLSAQRSKDPSSQVGACIVNQDNKIVGIGYNGMPNGCDDDLLPWSRSADDRLETKYPYVCHAELNAIMNKNSADVKGCTMYVALFPCNECAKLIIQAGGCHQHKHSFTSPVTCSYGQFKPKRTEIVIDFNSINHPGMLNSATK